PDANFLMWRSISNAKSPGISGISIKRAGWRNKPRAGILPSCILSGCSPRDRNDPRTGLIGSACPWSSESIRIDRVSRTVVRYRDLEEARVMVFGLGPVLRYELITTSRRGRYYLARVLYGLFLLFSLSSEFDKWELAHRGGGTIEEVHKFAESAFIQF